MAVVEPDQPLPLEEDRAEHDHAEDELRVVADIGLEDRVREVEQHAADHGARMAAGAADATTAVVFSDGSAAAQLRVLATATLGEVRVEKPVSETGGTEGLRVNDLTLMAAAGFAHDVRVDGDLVADIVVGADQADTAEAGMPDETHRGAVYVIRGGPHLDANQTVDLANFDAAQGGTVLAGHVARVTPPPGGAISREQ